MKNKKIYKAIACVSVWLAVVLACVGLACFNSSKVNAGVVIEESYLIDNNAYDVYLQSTSNLRKAMQVDDLQYLGIEYMPNMNAGFAYIFTDQRQYEGQTINANTRLYTLTIYGYDGATANVSRVLIQFARYSGSSANISNTYFSCELATINNIVYLIIDFTRLNQVLNLSDATIVLPLSSTANGQFFEKSATIKNVSNIYDLQQGDVAIIYISDVSGFDSSSYQPEITLNWGYIDSSDNTVYAAYSPTINVMKGLDDLEIWLNIPTDAGGTVYDSVILNQQVLLSLITDGASSANANIYALYVWLLSDRIQWGLLNFNTAGLPASALSMNYFTSYTTKYDYINNNTGSMTCRLSISNNFNFITIKNMPVFSVNTINNTLRQGGLLPAWSLYNWARGTATGFVSGQQAGAAPYQPGNEGYNEIYQAGYNAGLTAQPAAAWYEAAFAAVDSFLNIHIFPNITFGELFGIPFVISVVWFIIRMFRGGGSNG